MKKIRYFCGLLLFILFVPKVYAFTYDMDMYISDTSVKKGTVKEITVSLKNVKDAVDGIMACSLNIELDNNLVLNDNIRTLNNWSMMNNDFYLFDTGTPVTNDTKIFVIPVKVNGEGTVKLTNIKCSDGNTNEVINNKSINFTIVSDTAGSKPTTNNNTNNEQSNNQVDESSNCDLADIQLSDGEIDFDPAITEYNIKVSDFEKLEVTPVKASDKAIYIMDSNFSQDGEYAIVITVQAENGNTKSYTINVFEETLVKEEKKNNSYTPIFIGIICVLVLINIVRIVIKKKK